MQARCWEGSSAVTLDSCKHITIVAMTIHTSSMFGVYDCFSTGTVYRSVCSDKLCVSRAVQWSTCVSQVNKDPQIIGMH